MLLLWWLIPFLCVATANPHTTRRTSGTWNAQKIQTRVLTSCLGLPLALACRLASTISVASGTLEESDADKMKAKTPNGVCIFLKCVVAFTSYVLLLRPKTQVQEDLSFTRDQSIDMEVSTNRIYNLDVQNKRKKNDMNAAAVKQMNMRS